MEKNQPANQVKRRVNLLEVRTKMPQAFRALALLALAVTILIVGVGFWQARKNKEFRMKGMPTELSRDVVAVINGYERRETDGEILKYYIRADKATTFTDNHQELENAYLEAYDEAGEKFDKISANRAIYVPNADDSKLFNAFFSGNVDIETRDHLRVKTEQLSYDRATETAESEELVEFARENISGKSFGAIVKVKEKRLELLKDVEINAFADETAAGGEFEKTNLQRARITAGSAVVEQEAEKIELTQNVNINLTPKTGAGGEISQPTDVHAEKVTAFLENKQIRRLELNENVEVSSKPTAQNPRSTKTRAARAVATIDEELKRLELFENVEIETAQNGAKPTRIRASQATYEKDADRFELRNGVEIVTVEDNQPTIIRANEAVYEQTNGKIFLTGNAEITQGSDFIKGDAITAELNGDKKLQKATTRGNAYLKQAAERTTEVWADEMSALFSDNQKIQIANASGNVRTNSSNPENQLNLNGSESLVLNFEPDGILKKMTANGASSVTVIPSQSPDYSKLTLSAPKSIQLLFVASGGKSVLSQMQTEGRTAVVMSAAAGNPKSTNRKLTADSVKTFLNQGGKDLLKAEAIGNAELYVEPTVNSPDNFKTTVTASRFDCDFYETGNNPKICVANGKSKAVLVPTVASKTSGTRTLSAEKLLANFNQNSQDIERFDAIGGAKFSELDRNGTAGQMTFTANDEIVRLRDGQPTVWDSQARAKASEIDWDTRNQKSFLRGRVSTTYYSQKQTNGALPFGKTNSPIFITAAEAQFDHRADVGVYLGNARAWQENNYVRAEKLVLQLNGKRFDGEGKVQSLLYNVRRKEGEKSANQPVFVAADKVFYTDENKLLHYEGNVDIRQGTDRIVAGIAEVFLNENNEVKQTLVQNNVVITQPNRRVTGTWAQYTTLDETVILRGSPATVIDTERGRTEGSQLTVSMRENRVVNQGSASPNRAGRTRTVYKIKNQ